MTWPPASAALVSNELEAPRDAGPPRQEAPMSSTATPVSRGLVQLAEHCCGTVVLPGDAGWDAARQPWNVAVDQRPAAVVVPERVEDVAVAVRFAAEHGLRVAVQGTGHQAAARASMEDALLLRMDRMTRVHLDCPNRFARVEGGALWGDVVEQASPRGLAALHGSSPDVGIVGYTMGGGIGWLARKYGLAANSVQAIEVVTAEGGLVRADREHDPELFWALRGGGGSFGVVTAMEFALYPVSSIYAGWLVWPWDRSREVLEAWRDWTRHTPDEVTSVARILQLPDLELVPEHLRGRNIVVIEAALLGSYDEGVELFWPLRRLGPELDTFQMVAPAGLSMLHMDPLGPTPAAGDGFLVDELPDAAIDAFVAAGGPGSGSPLASIELRQLGGALRRAPEGAGALPTLEAGFAYFGCGLPLTPELGSALERQMDTMADALAPWQAARSYRNFAEREVHPRAFNGAAAYRRLRDVRSTYDPGGLFAPAHEIRAAS
jgi:FAD/FMN-containing dehydrogenase